MSDSEEERRAKWTKLGQFSGKKKHWEHWSDRLRYALGAYGCNELINYLEDDVAIPNDNETWKDAQGNVTDPLGLKMKKQNA